MQADKELIEYIEKRLQYASEMEEKYEPHGDDRFKHIYHRGEKSAFKEVLNILIG